MEVPVLRGSISAPPEASSRAPAFAGSLPAYGTLAYLEKLGTVALLALAFVYLIVRTCESGARAAIAEVGGKKL